MARDLKVCFQKLSVMNNNKSIREIKYHKKLFNDYNTMLDRVIDR